MNGNMANGVPVAGTVDEFELGRLFHKFRRKNIDLWRFWMITGK